MNRNPPHGKRCNLPAILDPIEKPFFVSSNTPTESPEGNYFCVPGISKVAVNQRTHRNLHCWSVRCIGQWRRSYLLLANRIGSLQLSDPPNSFVIGSPQFDHRPKSQSYLWHRRIIVFRRVNDSGNFHKLTRYPLNVVLEKPPNLTPVPPTSARLPSFEIATGTCQ